MHIRTVACLLVMLTVIGCRPRVTVNDGPDGVGNLRRVVISYHETTAERGRPPQSIDDMTPSLKKRGDPKTLLQSPRDGQPYVIVWGIDYRKMADLNPKTGKLPIIAYEEKGKAGKQQVIDMGMTVKEYTVDEFKKLKPLGNGPPSSSDRNDFTKKQSRKREHDKNAPQNL